MAMDTRPPASPSFARILKWDRVLPITGGLQAAEWRLGPEEYHAAQELLDKWPKSSY